MSAFDLEKMVVVGSVADGTDGPDSHIDLLVTSARNFARNRNLPGSTEFEPGHRGTVVHERPIA